MQEAALSRNTDRCPFPTTEEEHRVQGQVEGRMAVCAENVHTCVYVNVAFLCPCQLCRSLTPLSLAI